LKILYHIAIGYCKFSQQQFKNVLDLYNAIDAQATTGDVCVGEKTIRAKFNEGYLILKSEPDEDNDLQLCRPEDCVWDGPPQMESKVSLKSMYKQVTSEEQLADLSQFFTCRLAIPNATIEDVIEELELLSENDETDFDRIKGVYTYLSKLDIRSSKDKLR
jgi:hypothetical protein